MRKGNYKTPERTRILNNLNRQRNRLAKKGASPQELEKLFSISNNNYFGELSTKELKKIKSDVDTYAGKRGLTVQNNGIPIPLDVSEKADFYNKTNFNESVEYQSQEKIKKSSFFKNRDITMKQYKDTYYKVTLPKRKKGMISRLQGYGIDNEIIEQMEKMNPNKFIEMMKSEPEFNREEFFLYNEIPSMDIGEIESRKAEVTTAFYRYKNANRF